MLNRFRFGTRVLAVSLAAGTVFVNASGFAAPVTTVAASVPAAVEVAVKAGAAAFAPAVWTGSDLGGVDRHVFALALDAASHAVRRGDAEAPRTLTVIDFSKPSTEKRMWVFDVESHALLFRELVAHGRGSGANMATAFSNVPDSNQSSLGLFRTGESYIGKHGLSLRLDGLERGVNDRARERAIVIHGADYVNGATARAQGRLGRSLGCPAVRPEIAAPLIRAVEDGGLLFAYYPEPAWLESSAYLN
jgi:hypothetical protein